LRSDFFADGGLLLRRLVDFRVLAGGPSGEGAVRNDDDRDVDR